jgi:hypothetical protein
MTKIKRKSHYIEVNRRAVLLPLNFDDLFLDLFWVQTFFFKFPGHIFSRILIM